VTAWQRYVAYWNERESPETVGLLRIAFGLCIIVNVSEQIVHGTITEIYATVGSGGIFTISEPTSVLSLFHYLEPSSELVWALVVAQLGMAVLLTLGFYTRLSSFILFILQITFFDRMVMFRYGGDAVLCVFSWLMVLTPGGATWSLDSWMRGHPLADVPAWPRRLWMAQLAIIYTQAGLVKLGTMWSFIDGWSAFYLAVNVPGIARRSGEWAAYVYPMTQIGTLISSWWELTFFILPINQFLRRRERRCNIFMRVLCQCDLRKIYLPLGILMHITIWITLDVGLFGLAMLCPYLSYLTPKEIRSLTPQHIAGRC